jgi:hypothetical protein
VRAFPGPGLQFRVSRDGGSDPLWAKKNSKQLFYRWQDQLWVAEIDSDSGSARSKRRRIFEKSGYADGAPVRSWDLSHDGQSFLMTKLDQSKPTPVTEMVLVQNWFEELKQRAPKK